MLRAMRRPARFALFPATLLAIGLGMPLAVPHDRRRRLPA